MYFPSCALMEQLLSNKHRAINKTDKYVAFPNYMWVGRKLRASKLDDNPKGPFRVRSHCRGLRSHL